jgi:hypothetical protein
MPDDPKKKKNIFSRIVAWFKKAAEWIPEHLGDPAIAPSIREDLGLAPGARIDAAKNQKFVQFGSGLDPDKEGFSETVAEISDVAQEIKTLAATLKTDDFPAGRVSYTLLKLAATDSVRLRWPFLYALSRAVLFLEEDTEALIMIDPARLLRQLRGEDLPSGEILAQRITGAGTVVLQLLDAFTSKEKNEANVGHVDVFYRMGCRPRQRDTEGGSRVDACRHVQHRRRIGHRRPAACLPARGPVGARWPRHLLVVRWPADDRAGLDGVTFRVDAGFPNAFDAYFGFEGSRIPTTIEVPTPPRSSKFGIASGVAGEPTFRLGEPDETRLDIYRTEFGIDVWKENAGFHAALRDASW